MPPLSSKLTGYDHRASTERISDSHTHVVTIDTLTSASRQSRGAYEASDSLLAKVPTGGSDGRSVGIRAVVAL